MIRHPPASQDAGRRRPLMELIGRSTELEAIEHVLEGRLVTIVGAGGIGKTMVARHVFHAARSTRASASLWIDLGWVTNAEEMSIAWSQALGKPGQSGQKLIDTIDDMGPILLVIDNCEHVLGLIAPIIEAIVETCDQTRVLATSRESLGIVGERVRRLTGLSVPPDGVNESEGFDAVELFLARARQVRPDVRLDRSDLAHVAVMCRLLDGNPLGLILAAGHLRALSLSQLRASVEKSNAVIKNQRTPEDPRHFSIDASLQWSFDLLSETERDVLVALTAFPSKFDLDGARAVAAHSTDGDRDVLPSIERLVDHGLVDFDGDRDYHLPFVVRRFALDRGERSDQVAAARERHARLVLEWASGLWTWGEVVRPDLIDRRIVDVHVALTWAMEHDAHLTDRSLATFGIVLNTTAVYQECLDWLVSRTDGGLDWVRAMASFAVWEVVANANTYPELEEPIQRAVLIAAQANDVHLEQRIACPGVCHATLLGDLGPARRLTREARAADNGRAIIATGTTASFSAAMLGCVRDATEFCTATRWACEQGRVPYRMTAGHLAEVLMAQQSGRTDEANVLIMDATQTAAMKSGVLMTWALIAFEQGDLDRLDRIRDQFQSNDPSGVFIRALATASAQFLRNEFASASATAISAPDIGPLYNPRMSLFAAGALLRGGATANRVTDELDRAAGFMSSIPECPAFEISEALLRAQVCLREDDVDGAAGHVYPALEQARVHQQRLRVIDALETVAELLERRGSKKRALTLRAACIQARAEFGYRSTLFAPDQALVDEETDEPIDLDTAIAIALRARGARRRPATGLASLTPTETTVVELVTAGQTNAEIATHLAISVATVKAHLSHIFPKLGVSNRTQLAGAINQSKLPR